MDEITNKEARTLLAVQPKTLSSVIHGSWKTLLKVFTYIYYAM